MKSKAFGNAYEKLYLITPMVCATFKDCISEKQKDNLDHLNQTYTDPTILENSDNDLSTLDTALDSEMTQLTTVPNSSVENEDNMTLTNDTVSVNSVPLLDPTESNYTAPASMHNSADASTQISAGSNLPKTIKYVNSSTEMDDKKYVESSTQMNNKKYVDSVSQTDGKNMSPSSTQTNDLVIANGNDDSHISEFRNNQVSHPTYPNLLNENCKKSDRFKPYICTQCSKSYTTPSSLNRHRKNVHNIALPPKRLKNKLQKNLLTHNENKELKKVMKSKLKKKGKKINHSKKNDYELLKN
jgi:hypothetical protein